MELRHLRYFQAVAETLNFSRAAERLRIAQPPLSRQIRDLEAELGVALFSRTHGRVQLTPAGRHLQRELPDLLQRLANLVAATQRAARGGEALNIGTDWRLPLDPLARAVSELRQRERTTAQINFVDLPLTEQLAALRDGRIDLAFLPDVFLGARRGLESLRVASPAVMAALPESHPLARRRTLTLGELRDERWVLLNPRQAPGFRDLVVQICRKAQFTPKFGPTAPTMDGMLTLVAAGEGVCPTLASFARSGQQGVQLVETDCEPFALSAIWQKSNRSELLPAYLRCLREQVATGSA
ncbi:MAG TPA: LysR family transcriptional regulator [Opitutaceae bacterium]|nr:LysR family transcriptional regulator [Opitutaceae bacterium]